MSKSFFQATRDEIQAANKRFLAFLISNPDAIQVVELTGPECGELLGIRVMGDEDTKNGIVPWTTYKKKQYVATKNKSNRPCSVPNMKNLMKFHGTGRWALNGETIIFDELSRCCSAQHRLGSAYFYSLDTGDTTTRFPFILVRGVPEIVVDSIDTGKSRDNKDILTRHEDIFKESSLRTITGNKVTGSTVVKLRQTLSKETNTVCRLLWLRTNAKDIKASSTGYKQEEIFDVMQRFHPATTDNPKEGIEPFSTELEQLLQLVYNQDTGTSGKSGTLNKYLGRADVATALVLHSNKDQDPVPSADSSRKFGLPDKFEIDLEFAEAFCSCASRGDGFMLPLYSYLDNNYGSGKEKLDPQYLFGALVNAVNWFADNYKKDKISTVNEDTGETTETVTYSCPPLQGHGIPKYTGARQEKKRKITLGSGLILGVSM